MYAFFLWCFFIVSCGILIVTFPHLIILKSTSLLFTLVHIIACRLPSPPSILLPFPSVPFLSPFLFHSNYLCTPDPPWFYVPAIRSCLPWRLPSPPSIWLPFLFVPFYRRFSLILVTFAHLTFPNSASLQSILTCRGVSLHRLPLYTWVSIYFIFLSVCRSFSLPSHTCTPWFYVPVVQSCPLNCLQSPFTPSDVRQSLLLGVGP